MAENYSDCYIVSIILSDFKINVGDNYCYFFFALSIVQFEELVIINDI